MSNEKMEFATCLTCAMEAVVIASGKISVLSRRLNVDKDDVDDETRRQRQVLAAVPGPSGCSRSSRLFQVLAAAMLVCSPTAKTCHRNEEWRRR